MCSCSEYQDLEFSRELITRRIKDSRSLKKAFEVLGKHPGKEHKLYRCNSCGQFWQGSRAWNWGNDEYLFRVPPIDVGEWLSDVFVQPDELLIFSAVVGDFLAKNDFSPKETQCSVSGCTKSAVTGSVNCLLHHLEGLQRARMIPAYPAGRWFGPYIRENIVPSGVFIPQLPQHPACGSAQGVSPGMVKLDPSIAQ